MSLLVDMDISEATRLIMNAPKGSSMALCQVDSKWLDTGNQEVQRLRSAIDRSIYRRLLTDTSHSITVFRILAYDPPSDIDLGLHRKLVAEKKRWQADLFRQQSLLGRVRYQEEGMDPGQAKRVVSTRFFVFGRAGQAEHAPPDRLEVASSERQLSASFREVWTLPRVFGEARTFQDPLGLRDPENLLVDLGRVTAESG